MTRGEIVPCLWYWNEAEEAANFYAEVFPDSRVLKLTTLPSEPPSGPAHSVKIVEFELLGRHFTAISAGPLDSFNHAISLMVKCNDQAEIDRYWDALLANGGTPERCGWVRDRFGLYWQIVPAVLAEMIADPDMERSRRVAEAMLEMSKFDIASLEAAYSGSGRTEGTGGGSGG